MWIWIRRSALLMLLGTLGTASLTQARSLSENFVVGPRASVFSPGKDGEAGDMVISSMQPDAARREKGRPKPGRLFRQSLV